MPDYAAIRETIKSGDLIFSASDGWKSRLVRWWTQSPYSHAAVAVRGNIGGIDRVWIVEAVLTGVRITPLSQLRRFKLARTPVIWSRDAGAYITPIIGQQYSQTEAVLAGLGIRLGGNDRYWQCAELAKAILMRCSMRSSHLALLDGALETPAALLSWALQIHSETAEVINGSRLGRK